MTAATPATRHDGSERLRFVFSVSMADRDAQLLETLKEFLGVGSLRHSKPRNVRWLPQVHYAIGSRVAHRLVMIPFADEFLLPGAKRTQFERWRVRFEEYERDNPTRIGEGPSECSEPGCDRPVRGRGLCRSHYYLATGY